MNVSTAVNCSHMTTDEGAAAQSQNPPLSEKEMRDQYTAAWVRSTLAATQNGLQGNYNNNNNMLVVVGVCDQDEDTDDFIAVSGAETADELQQQQRLSQASIFSQQSQQQQQQQHQCQHQQAMASSSGSGVNMHLLQAGTSTSARGSTDSMSVPLRKTRLSGFDGDDENDDDDEEFDLDAQSTNGAAGPVLVLMQDRSDPAFLLKKKQQQQQQQQDGLEHDPQQQQQHTASHQCEDGDSGDALRSNGTSTHALRASQGSLSIAGGGGSSASLDLLSRASYGSSSGFVAALFAPLDGSIGEQIDGLLTAHEAELSALSDSGMPGSSFAAAITATYSDHAPLDASTLSSASAAVASESVLAAMPQPVQGVEDAAAREAQAGSAALVKMQKRSMASLPLTPS